MKICITGTPGTGKTTVSEKVAKKLCLEPVHLTKYFKKKDIGNNETGVREINVEDIQNLFHDQDDILIEGHLSHHTECDIVVVLRTDPETLEERLSKRRYDPQKIMENVESEKLDLILVEAVNKCDTVIEVDTSDKKVEDTVTEIVEKVEKGENSYGETDWSNRL